MLWNIKLTVPLVFIEKRSENQRKRHEKLEVKERIGTTKRTALLEPIGIAY